MLEQYFKDTDEFTVFKKQVKSKHFSKNTMLIFSPEQGVPKPLDSLTKSHEELKSTVYNFLIHNVENRPVLKDIFDNNAPPGDFLSVEQIILNKVKQNYPDGVENHSSPFVIVDLKNQTTAEIFNFICDPLLGAHGSKINCHMIYITNDPFKSKDLHSRSMRFLVQENSF